MKEYSDMNECCIDLIGGVISSGEHHEVSYLNKKCEICGKLHRIVSDHGSTWSEGIDGKYPLEEYTKDGQIKYDNDQYTFESWHGVVDETKCPDCECEFSLIHNAYIVVDSDGNKYYFIMPACFNCNSTFEPIVDEYTD